MARTTTQRLAAYQARYTQLAGQLANVGFIAAGSITHRYTHCASPGCRCNADPPQPHGPYYHGPPRSTARPSPSDSPPTKPTSTRNGSPTTGNSAPSSPRCATSPPKPPT